MLHLVIWINVWPGPSFPKAYSATCRISCSWSTQSLKPWLKRRDSATYHASTAFWKLSQSLAWLLPSCLPSESPMADLLNIHFFQSACTLHGALKLLKCSRFWSNSIRSLNTLSIKHARSSVGRHLELRYQGRWLSFSWVWVCMFF